MKQGLLCGAKRDKLARMTKYNLPLKEQAQSEFGGRGNKNRQSAARQLCVMEIYKMKPDKRFEPLMKELNESGLTAGKHYYESELWFYEQGLDILKRRAGLPSRVDDAQPDEIKFSQIVYKHFPELRNK